VPWSSSSPGPENRFVMTTNAIFFHWPSCVRGLKCAQDRLQMDRAVRADSPSGLRVARVVLMRVTRPRHWWWALLEFRPDTGWGQKLPAFSTETAGLELASRSTCSDLLLRRLVNTRSVGLTRAMPGDR
jgi:hypothetical protein